MRQSNKVYVTLTGTRLAQTAKAVKFSILQISGTPVDLPVEHKIQWFPLSQIQKMTTDPNKSGEDIIVASEWICKEKGLMEKIDTHPAPKIDEHGFDARAQSFDEDDREDDWNGETPF